MPEPDQQLPRSDDHTPLPQRIVPAALAGSQPQAFSPGPVEPDGGADWRRYVAAVIRYKWLVILGVALGLAGGIGAGRFVSSEYVAQATVWIENPVGRGGDTGPLQQGQLLESYGWEELLRSYIVLDDAVARLKLYLRPSDPADSALFREFGLKERFQPGAYELAVDDAGAHLRLSTAQGILIEQAEPGDSVGTTVGFDWVPPLTSLRPGREVRFVVTAPRDAAVSLGQQMRTRSDRNGNFLRVELRGSNPDRTANAVNAVTERYVDVAEELKREKLALLTDRLREQLDSARIRLQQAEMALEDFRVQTITLPTEQSGPVAPGIQETRNPVIGRFTQLRVDADELTTDRERLRQVLARPPDSGLAVEALEGIASVQASANTMQALAELREMQAELRVLRSRYTDQYELVTRLVAEIRERERNTIPTLLAALADELDARIGSLDSQIERSARELREIPSRAIEEGRRRRAVDVAENLYTMLQQRYEEARLAELSAVADVRILDAAVAPQRPVSDQSRRFILLGVVAGVGLGLAGAVLLDRIDRRLRYPEQVTADLGLPLLGVVPHLKGSRNGSLAAETAPVVEAIRGVRLNLIHACGAASPLVVTVTSPGSGDGKSFVASNLALAFADAGHRTLLIDGDVRRGGLHRVLSVARKPGITDLLSSSAQRREAIQETAFGSLHFLGCGTRTSQAPELLGSAEMTRLLTSLRSAYSVIIVDSPPLGAGVDSFALGTLTGNMVIVLRLGQTDRELTEAKLDVLDRLPVRVLGAVLNDVRDGAGSRYYRYYSYYLPGYDTSDEAGEPKAALVEGKKSKAS